MQGGTEGHLHRLQIQVAGPLALGEDTAQQRSYLYIMSPCSYGQNLERAETMGDVPHAPNGFGKTLRVQFWTV